MAQEDEDRIINTLKKDSRFLRDNQLMDYSLLYLVSSCASGECQSLRGYHLFRRLSLDGQHYSFGIIDYLQRFNRRKFLEMYLKKLFYFRDSDFVSCQHQSTYSKRFISFIKPIFSKRTRKNQALINAFREKNT